MPTTPPDDGGAAFPQITLEQFKEQYGDIFGWPPVRDAIWKLIYGSKADALLAQRKEKP